MDRAVVTDILQAHEKFHLVKLLVFEVLQLFKMLASNFEVGSGEGFTYG